MFDLDDVLIMTIQWYWARWEMFRYVMVQLGFGKYEGEIIDKLNEIDIANVERNGFRPEAFGWAMGETYAHYCRVEGREPDPLTREGIEDIGHSVFMHRPILYPGVLDSLGALKAQGHRLYCVTKGDVPNQTRKVAEAGLAHFFESIHVVPDDKKGVLEDLLEMAGGEAAKDDVFFVGNSVRSDIKPALELGIIPIWIPCYTWEFEEDEGVEVDESRVVRLGSISELPGYFSQQTKKE